MPSPELFPATSPVLEPVSFDCAVRHSNRDGAWVRASGELDLASAPHLEQCLGRALGGARLVVVDLRLLSFMDSTGIHLLVRAHDRAVRTGRRLVLIRGPVRIDRLLDLAGLSHRLEIADLTPIQVAQPPVALPSGHAA